MKAFVIFACLVAVAFADGDHAHVHEAPAEGAIEEVAPIEEPVPAANALPLAAAPAPFAVRPAFAPLPLVRAGPALPLVRAPLPIAAPIAVAAPLPAPVPVRVAPVAVPAPTYGPAPVPTYGPAPVEAFDPPVYNFGYGVEGDDIHGNARFGHNEDRNGYTTNGEYRVHLPDGRIQIVTYNVLDANSGFVADVKYEGEPIAYVAPRPAYAPAPVPTYGAVPVAAVAAK